VVSLLFPVSIAMADQSTGNRGRVHGLSEITYQTDNYAKYEGETWITYLLMPDQMILTLDLFKGDTWIGPGFEDEIPPPNAFLLPGTYEASSDVAGDWQGCGWHYAYWMLDGIEDSCSTYDPPIRSSAVFPVDARLDAYCVSGSQEVMGWHKVRYLGSSEILKTLLGLEAGVSLDKTLHLELRSYLSPGDKMPGLLVAPDGARAVALFFHVDGTVTAVMMSNAERSEWEVLDVRVERLAEDPTE
jgi:hypothetical protein